MPSTTPRTVGEPRGGKVLAVAMDFCFACQSGDEEVKPVLAAKDGGTKHKLAHVALGKVVVGSKTGRYIIKRIIGDIHKPGWGTGRRFCSAAKHCRLTHYRMMLRGSDNTRRYCSLGLDPRTNDARIGTRGCIVKARAGRRRPERETWS